MQKVHKKFGLHTILKTKKEIFKAFLKKTCTKFSNFYYVQICIGYYTFCYYHLQSYAFAKSKENTNNTYNTIEYNIVNQSCRFSISKYIQLYCCSENSDSKIYKGGDSSIPAFNYGVFVASMQDFKLKVNSNSLSVFTYCILIWEAEWLDKKRDELVIDSQIDCVPFTFES